MTLDQLIQKADEQLQSIISEKLEEFRKTLVAHGACDAEIAESMNDQAFQLASWKADALVELGERFITGGHRIN